MKKFLFVLSLICLISNTYGQGNVGIGNPNPDPSAILDLTATDKGFLVPRTRVGLIASPARGLVIYDTDTNCYVLFNGTTWNNLCNPNIPVKPFVYNDAVYFTAGGNVTVVDSGGQHILTSTQAAWLTTGNSGTTAGTNFAGTTDAQDFVLKANNAEVIRATTAGAVGINQPAPNASAILDINSTAKGVLFPSMSTTQINAIAAPAVGLTVYNNTINVHQFWNGTCWVNVGQTVCSFAYSTSFISPAHTGDCLLVSNFSSVSDTISVNLVSGTASPVILTAVGVPAGVLVNFSNNYILPTAGGIQSIMTFTALPSAASGTYTVTVLASSGSTVQTLTYTLNVFGFNLAINPNSSTVSAGTLTPGGNIATATVSIGNASACSSSGGIAQLSATVNATNGGVASGINVSFSTTSMPIPGSATMTIVSNCPPAGVYTITVQALIGVTSSYATYTLTVTGTAPIHITASTNNVDLSTLIGAGFCAGSDTIYVDAGVVIGSSSPTLPAMTTGNIPSGGAIVLINNGTIQGAGGAGGQDPSSLSSSSCPSADGQNGGDAILIASSVNVRIINNGTIASGGGGGGAGAALSAASLSTCIFSGGAAPGGSGGGGAGTLGGAGGANVGCSAGQNGTASAGGSGGAAPSSGGCGCSGIFGIGAGHSGAGGAGGGPGLPGNNGSSATTGTGVCPAGQGGQPGYSINGNNFSSYIASGNTPAGPTHN